MIEQAYTPHTRIDSHWQKNVRKRTMQPERIGAVLGGIIRFGLYGLMPSLPADLQFRTTAIRPTNLGDVERTAA
jgi:hypothetical protein